MSAVRTALDGLRSDATKLGILADALLAREMPGTSDLSDLKGLAAAIANHTAHLVATSQGVPDASDLQHQSAQGAQ
jgi:hypothetical protein